MKIEINNVLKKNTAFTLIELMIVIAIISIMASISIPSFFKSEYKVKKVARELMGDMQQTRMGAIKTNQDWAIVFVPDDQYLICSSSGADGIWSGAGITDNTIEKNITFSSYAAGVKYGHGPATTNATTSGGTFPSDDISYNPNVVSFNSRGTCGSQGYVYITSGDATYAVGTLTTGIIRIKRWQGGAWR